MENDVIADETEEQFSGHESLSELGPVLGDVLHEGPRQVEHNQHENYDADEQLCVVVRTPVFGEEADAVGYCVVELAAQIVDYPCYF